MGNAILRFFKGEYDDTPPPASPHRPGIASRSQFASPAAVGLTTLAHDLLNFESTSQANGKPSQSNRGTKHFNEEDTCSVASSTAASKGSKVTSTLASAPVFKCSEHAKKRREFYQKLEGKHQTLEAEKTQSEAMSKVLQGLNQHVTLSKKAQTKSPPRTPEEAARLVDHTLQVQIDALEEKLARLLARAVQGRIDALVDSLQFYSLPFPQIQTQVSGPSSWPEGVQFELHTLPIDAKLVGDGDGMTVHVSTKDPRESSIVPLEVQKATIKIRQAQAIRDYARADALHKSITNCGYRVITTNNEEILAREYRIRLRGIDAPEMNMEYGQEAKDALTKLIQEKPLTIYVYDKDPYDRFVGDVYCNGIFVQEKLLRKGCAWHYKAFDKRSAFAQKEARNAGRGLWANPNPVEPWEFKRKKRNRKKTQRPYQNKRNAERDQRVPIHAY